MCWFCGCGGPHAYESVRVILPSALKANSKGKNPKGKKEGSRPQPAKK